MTNTRRFTTAVLFGLGTVVVLASAASLLMALLLMATNISDKTMTVVLFILALCSTLAAGFISGVKAKMKGWLAGGTTGVLFSFLVFLVNYLGYSQGLSQDHMIYHLGLLAASMIGGIFGVNMANKA
ncbi:TIGR04086 family membrane protein [Ectobacillus ponti]|uniref:TIGR04086 family membrane protein n=1 Tax=Ectobacillus ponti TaxID=2961894 RepID=A0AA41X299_9BACI|nr:TIGR04086 family membrane protein [Ectobacillus ponti]MCP8967292.1 TIGR04086 family membrane protein [Ectobacillus ponti]